MTNIKAPTPTHEVVVSSPRGGEDFYTIDDAAARGDNDTCVAYICAHRPARNCKFAIRYIKSKRLTSFMVPSNHSWKV